MTRRKKVVKPKTESGTEEMRNDTFEMNYTPAQIEQANSAKELDCYIKEFDSKVKKLKSSLLDRELVILFVANLRSRWKQLVEPMEYFFKNWNEAAEAALYHCIKLSISLQIERFDTDPMFTTHESLEVMRSDYFAPSNRTNDVSSPSTLPIPHKVSSDIATTDLPSALEDKTHYANEKKTCKNESETTQESTIDTETKSIKKLEDIDIEKPEREKHETKEGPANVPDRKKADNNPDSRKESLQSIENTSLPIQSFDLENSVHYPEDSVCYKLPECYKGVNSMILGLKINGKSIRGLLSKWSWSYSAISLDCVKKLKLPIMSSNQFCTSTEFGSVETLGLVVLPIVHPSDPSIKSEMVTYILPSIYGGKVELILGSDFFSKFNPTLNIRKRAIKFLAKETPYIVNILS